MKLHISLPSLLFLLVFLISSSINAQTISDDKSSQLLHIKARGQYAGVTIYNYTGNLTVDAGVVIADLFDLGKYNESSLDKMGIPEDIKEKLKPYLGKKGQLAQIYSYIEPLTLTKSEYNLIDKLFFKYLGETIENIYNANIPKGAKQFGDLSPHIQTIVASVALQYSLNWDRSTPRFFNTVLNHDWKAMVTELMDFDNGKYQYKRDKDLEYLFENMNDDFFKEIAPAIELPSIPFKPDIPAGF